MRAKAMPLPVLQWLADQDLADTSAVEQGIIRLDPKISGVGPSKIAKYGDEVLALVAQASA